MHTAAQQPVTGLAGVGPALAARLAKLGIATLRDLLFHFPVRYDDLRSAVPIAELRLNERALVRGTLQAIETRRTFRRRVNVTEALLKDESGMLRVLWFNQPYLGTTLKPGDVLAIFGLFKTHAGRAQLVAQSHEKLDGRDPLHTNRLVPLYALTAGVTQRQMRSFVHQALAAAPTIPDPLPEELLRRHHLQPLSTSLRALHFPRDEAERDEALRRWKFEELLLFQLRRLRTTATEKSARAHALPFKAAPIRAFVASLPFALTSGQRKAAWHLLQRMEAGIPQHLLLQGDVGSGKTVVAAIAAVSAFTAGKAVALMAPTEILARQHALTLAPLFRAAGAPLFLATSGYRARMDGSETQLTTAALRTALRAGGPLCVVGTHALLEASLALPPLGLVIVDEQHRFGVAQRAAFLEKGGNKVRPHLLSLTATPIPRTLALALAGDLDVVTLKEQPKGRQPITTVVVEPSARDTVYTAVAKELHAGHRAFVVAPLIDPSDTEGVASAQELYEELHERFPRFALGLLHGKRSSKDKVAALADFAEGKTQLLVATAVVEVGIDVPAATVIVIEGAERFGLAQLHQLRGRIGRGVHASTCYLLPASLTLTAKKRLEALAATNDGFALARLDLSLRGPGDLLGLEQSGFLDFRFASLGDGELITTTLEAAQVLLKEDPTLAGHPLLNTSLKHVVPLHTE